jgi:beta-barrel assembly-enhancing protease
MRDRIYKNSIVSALVIWCLAFMPLLATAQTRINMPKNKYKLQDDIKLGQEAARQVQQQMPIIKDTSIDNYIENVGRRLAAAIPQQFQHPEFRYSFDVVNASDINAFALPGGPMFVNRGMIEAAKTEGEMAGVMAHEISHVALRHATAQQTKLNSPLNQILGAGAVIGGAIVGGQTGAQAGQIFAQGYFLRYSREYETQADILGSQIMADAGYDPRDLANMFQTIEKQGGSRQPEWLSSHPNPGNRYQKINAEAGLLRVSPDPIKVTPEFTAVKSRLQRLPRAQSMAEIEKEGPRNTGGGGQQSPTAGGNYSRNVEYPSTRIRTYSGGDWISMSVPENWRDFSGNQQITFAPEGGYGDQGITHGALIGVLQSSGTNLQQTTQDYINNLLQSNNYLQQQGGFQRSNIGNRQAYSTVLSGRSPITGQTEVVTIYTTQLRTGQLFYLATVAPGAESSRYNSTFRNMISSIRLND